MFAFNASKFKGCFNTEIMTIKVTEAITRRQKTMEKTLRVSRNLTKMAAVPNRVPAITPSVKAVFLLRLNNGTTSYI
jgi:hypothetical protein